MDLFLKPYQSLLRGLIETMKFSIKLEQQKLTRVDNAMSKGIYSALYYSG